MQNLSGLENFSLGSLTALVVGLTLQPTLYWKNAAQQGKPFTMDPRVIYRGLGAALSAEIGQMALQFYLTGMVQQLILGNNANRPMTAGEELTAALTGGAISALYTSPVELVMVQQQNFGSTMPNTAKRILSERGLIQGLSRGLSATMSRDAIYTAGLLGITPVVQRKLQERGFGSSTAGFCASVTAGVICGTVSCPLDAAKTCLQGDLMGTTYKGFFSTLSDLHSKGRLFGGVGWRVVNISGTIVIANEFKVRVAPRLFPSKFPEGTVSREFKSGH